MAVRVSLLCAFLCALLPLTAVGAPSASAPRVWVVGDSLAAGTAPYLPRYLQGWTVRQTVDVGYHLAEGVAVVRARGSALPPRLVISLGTNDDPRMVASFRRGVRAILETAGETRCVVWPTIVRPPAVGASYVGYNRALRAETALHANLRVVEWGAITRTHPEWLRVDGVHVTAAGYAARAAAIARALHTC